MADIIPINRGWGKRKPSLGTPLNKFHPLAKGLVGAWVMNERTGLIAFDTSGNRNFGSFIGSPTWVSTPNGSGIEITRDSTDVINLASSYTMGPIGSVVFSFSTNSSTYGFQMFFGENDVSDGFFALRQTVPDYNLRDDSGGSKTFTMPSSEPLNELIQITLTADGTNWRLYRGFDDGISQSYTSTLTVSDFGNAFNNDNHVLSGRLIYAYFFNYTLSKSEIANLHRDPYAMFQQPSPIWAFGVDAAPTGAIMNQIQKNNLGADLFNGTII